MIRNVMTIKPFASRGRYTKNVRRVNSVLVRRRREMMTTLSSHAYWMSRLAAICRKFWSLIVALTMPTRMANVTQVDAITITVRFSMNQSAQEPTSTFLRMSRAANQRTKI